MLTKEETINALKKELPHLKAIFGVKRIGLKFIELSDYIENLIGKKVDILTPGGIKSIRVKKVAEDIKKSIVYV